MRLSRDVSGKRTSCSSLHSTAFNSLNLPGRLPRRRDNSKSSCHALLGENTLEDVCHHSRVLFARKVVYEGIDQSNRNAMDAFRAGITPRGDLSGLDGLEEDSKAKWPVENRSLSWTDYVLATFALGFLRHSLAG